MDIRKWKKEQKKWGKKQKGQRQKTKMKPYEKQQEKRGETYVFQALDTRKKNGDVRGEDGMGSFVLVRFDRYDWMLFDKNEDENGEGIGIGNGE